MTGFSPATGSATGWQPGVQRAVVSPDFSEGKLHLLCDLHKAPRDFFGSVAGVRCRSVTLPALLPAVALEYPGVGEVAPTRNKKSARHSHKENGKRRSCQDFFAL